MHQHVAKELKKTKQQQLNNNVEKKMLNEHKISSQTTLSGTCIDLIIIMWCLK